jgi:glycosyltransferase involved in cell wall biosynthesis
VPTPVDQGDLGAAALPDVSVVISTCRQSEVVRDQVAQVLAALDRLGFKYEVLVAVDGDDGTVVELAQIEHDRLRVAVLDATTGKGNAVRRGLLSAGGRRRAFLDGGRVFLRIARSTRTSSSEDEAWIRWSGPSSTRGRWSSIP